MQVSSQSNPTTKYHPTKSGISLKEYITIPTMSSQNISDITNDVSTAMSTSEVGSSADTYHSRNFNTTWENMGIEISETTTNTQGVY